MLLIAAFSRPLGKHEKRARMVRSFRHPRMNERGDLVVLGL